MFHPVPVEKKEALLKLSHELGSREWGLVLLGEGNASVKASDDTFFVKASGSCLGSLEEGDLTECRFDSVLPLIGREPFEDGICGVVPTAQVDPDAKTPSIEVLFHAYFLSLPGIEFVAHTHPTAINQILCSGRGRSFAERRLFPDEVVFCGPASVFVPYANPGLPLARAIREATESYMGTRRRHPRLILLKNHGLISIGATAEGVLASTLMAEKAAKIFIGASRLNGGGEPDFLSEDVVQHIAGRADEQHRQRALNL
ncbi:MAG: class II aldolase/adducin family protein [Opitutales bacterium]